MVRPLGPPQRQACKQKELGENWKSPSSHRLCEGAGEAGVQSQELREKHQGAQFRS